ncbi:UNVERIFIED_CONTAM: hypothetical protein RMT77_003907 [Armadillidium vulgare]
MKYSPIYVSFILLLVVHAQGFNIKLSEDSILDTLKSHEDSPFLDFESFYEDYDSHESDSEGRIFILPHQFATLDSLSKDIASLKADIKELNEKIEKLKSSSG